MFSPVYSPFHILLNSPLSYMYSFPLSWEGLPRYDSGQHQPTIWKYVKGKFKREARITILPNPGSHCIQHLYVFLCSDIDIGHTDSIGTFQRWKLTWRMGRVTTIN